MKKPPTSDNKNILIRAVKAGGISHQKVDKIMVVIVGINYKDEQGMTALSNAIVNNTEGEIIQCMLDMGASKDIEIKNMSPAKYAQKQGTSRRLNY